MATIAGDRQGEGRDWTAPNRSEIALGWAALVLLGLVVIALWRGMGQWAAVPATVWVHLATMMTALALTPVMLWNPRGTPRHRVLGYIWVCCLLTTAIVTFWIRQSNHGHFSLIHILSAWTLLIVPMIVIAARSGNIVRHRRAVRGMVIGAVLTAGFFTLIPSRMLGHWLLG